jgi:hypothetical protein
VFQRIAKGDGIQVIDLCEKLSVEDLYYSRLLYWSVYVENYELCDILLTVHHVNPFRHIFHNKNVLHLACLRHDFPLIMFLLETKWYPYGEKNPKPMDVKEMLNMLTLKLRETPLHLVCKVPTYVHVDHMDICENNSCNEAEKLKIRIIKYLLLYGPDIEATNYRGWKPFQMTYSPFLRKVEKDWRRTMNLRMTDNDFDRDASQVEEQFFVNFDMEYQYLIVARKDNDTEKFEDNIIYQQLERVRLATHAICPNSFKFVTFESSIPTDADILMFACRISHELLAYKADK